MRTDEEQAEMRALEAEHYLQQLQDNQSEEYYDRVYYWKIDYSGRMTLPTSLDFHPNLWKGTQSEYDEIEAKHLRGREDCFKITDTHKFDTMDEYLKVYKNLH